MAPRRRRWRTDNGPITAQETLTYPTLLEDPNPPAETLAPAPTPAPLVTARAAAPKPAPPTPARAAPKPVTVAPRPAPQSTDAALPEPRGNGFVVQVAAVRKRAEADTIARRLSSKGYPAFVTTAGANFRVRVGKFDDRRQAELTAGRLEREEQFKPWITR